jgi:WD40 repeat protein
MQHTTRVIQVWDVANSRSVLRESLNPIYGLSYTFSSDSRQFVFEDDTRVRFFDTATWKEQPKWDKVYAPAMGLAYSPDGRMLATAGEGIRLYEVATHKLRAHISPLVYQWSAMRFSASGRYLTWVSHGTSIQIYDVHRGELLPALSGHDDTITGWAFTADERAIATSSADSTILLWRLPQTERVAGAPRKPNAVESAWKDLASDDGIVAFQAVRTLADSQVETVKWLAAALKAADPVDARQLESHLRELDNAKFAERDRATRSLEELGDRAIPALERFLAGKSTLEARRRAEQILAKARNVADPDRMRQGRALEVLERIGGDEAVKLLERLANGDFDATLTRDAKSTLQRLRSKP